MSDLPYTDNDLRAEAASCLSALGALPTTADIRRSLPDTYIDSHHIPDSGREATWAAVVGEDGLDVAVGEIHALIEGAADTSAWAVSLGADGLEPEDHELNFKAGGKTLARIHFAFAPELSDEARIALVEGMGEAAADGMAAAPRS